MRLRLVSVALAALLGLGLASCSDDPAPIVEPAPTDSPTVTEPTVMPTSTATADPAGESATAFIRRWQDTAFAMQTSGDTKAYLRLTRECESCAAFADTVARIYGDEGSIELEKPAVTRIMRVGRDEEVQVFEFDTVNSVTLVLDKNGKTSQRLEGGRTRFQVNLATTRSGDWRVTRISELVR